MHSLALETSSPARATAASPAQNEGATIPSPSRPSRARGVIVPPGTSSCVMSGSEDAVEKANANVEELVATSPQRAPELAEDEQSAASSALMTTH